MAQLNTDTPKLTHHPQYLAGLSILGAFALHSSHVYSLPIPDIICALTLALPPLAGIALETVFSLDQHLATKGQLQTSRTFQITVVAFVVFEAVLATLAGTHISPPGSLNCALRERWQKLFVNKDAEKILRIQDAFNCCGLNSPKDMAFPRPDRTHGADACMVRYERSTACMEPWRREEQKVAIMLLVVPLAVFIWKVNAHSRTTHSRQVQSSLMLYIPADRHNPRPILNLVLAAVRHPLAPRPK